MHAGFARHARDRVENIAADSAAADAGKQHDVHDAPALISSRENQAPDGFITAQDDQRDGVRKLRGIA